MDIFTTGITILFVMTAIFYIVVFTFFYYWHQKKITYVVPPVFFTFEFFAVSFMVVCLASFILNYLPELVRAFGL